MLVVLDLNVKLTHHTPYYDNKDAVYIAYNLSFMNALNILRLIVRFLIIIIDIGRISYNSILEVYWNHGVRYRYFAKNT